MPGTVFVCFPCTSKPCTSSLCFFNSLSEENAGLSEQSKHLKFLPKSLGVYGGWAVALVEPVGPVEVDVILLLTESIRYIDCIDNHQK